MKNDFLSVFIALYPECNSENHQLKSIFLFQLMLSDT